MATNSQHEAAEKAAKEKGYKWNSTGDKMINGSGKSMKPSETGNSWNLNGTTYNSSSDLGKSTKW